MQVTFEPSEAGGVMRLAGDLRVWNHADRGARVFEACEAIPESCRTLTLDLREVEHVDSAGIGILARLRYRWTLLGTALTVILPPGVPGQALRRVRIFSDCATRSATAA